MYRTCTLNNSKLFKNTYKSLIFKSAEQSGASPVLNADHAILKAAFKLPQEWDCDKTCFTFIGQILLLLVYALLFPNRLQILRREGTPNTKSMILKSVVEEHTKSILSNNQTIKTECALILHALFHENDSLPPVKSLFDYSTNNFNILEQSETSFPHDSNKCPKPLANTFIRSVSIFYIFLLILR